MQVLTRALGVLRFVASAPDPVTLSEISTELDLSPATVHRILASLVDEGFVSKDAQSRRYTAGSEILKMLNRRRALHLGDLAQASLTRLHTQFNETVFVNRLRERHTESVGAIESTHPLRLGVALGDTFPWHASASARAILAFLPEGEIDRVAGAGPYVRYTANTPGTRAELDVRLAQARKNGYDVCDDEFEERAWAVAAPIIGADGVVGSLALSAPGDRLASAAHRGRAIDAIRDEARRISEALVD